MAKATSVFSSVKDGACKSAAYVGLTSSSGLFFLLIVFVLLGLMYRFGIPKFLKKDKVGATETVKGKNSREIKKEI